MSEHELHDLVEGFRDPGRYERGRTAYPDAVVELVARELDLPPGATIVDVGAGTGMLARPFAAAGFDVIGAEPLPELRAQLATVLGPERALDAAAEALPLADASVAAAVCGDAFHWFDRPRAVAELHRVIRPGGGAGVVWRVPRVDRGAPWMAALAEAMERVRPPHLGYEHERGIRAFGPEAGFSEPLRHDLPFERVTDREGVLAYVASASFVALLPDERRRALLAQIAAEVPDGELRVPHVAETWITRRLP